MKIVSDRNDALPTTPTINPPSSAPASPAGAPQSPPLEYRGAFDPASRLSLHRRTTFVAVAISFSIMLVLVSMASIYRRWYNLRLPTSYILLRGDQTTANADVSVLRDGRRVARVTLKEEAGKYEVPVLVEPGLYTIETRVDGVLVLVHKFRLPDNARGVMIPITRSPNPAEEASLPTFRPGTRPASRPGG
jgi:hypothetical protein